jgi:hypothetical protein
MRVRMRCDGMGYELRPEWLMNKLIFVICHLVRKGMYITCSEKRGDSVYDRYPVMKRKPRKGFETDGYGWLRQGVSLYILYILCTY